MQTILGRLKSSLVIFLASLLCATASNSSVRFEYSSYSVPEDGAFVQIAVIRGGDTNTSIKVDYLTRSGSGMPDKDYRDAAGSVSFSPGELWKTFSIPVLNDGEKEATKTFSVVLTNATAAVVLGTPRVAGVSVRDNDPGVGFELKQYWGSESEGSIEMKVVRGNDVDLSPFTVDFATGDLTALAATHYVQTNGTLSFAQGEISKTVVVALKRDGMLAGEKKFRLSLSNPSAGLSLGTSPTTTVTILDSDGMAPHSIGGIAIQPGGDVLLKLTGASAAPQFKPFLDLYPIETSTDLVHWSVIGAALQSNDSPAGGTYTDTNRAGVAARFYRTPAGNRALIFPPPSGPYAVGRQHRLLIDSSRHNRYAVSTNISFWITVWYPAAGIHGLLTPAPLEPPNLATAFIQDGSDPRRVHFWGEAPQGVPLAATPSAFPVVLYSCGGHAIRGDNSLLALELASHGYVVVSADHEDLAYAELPDGRIVSGTLPEDSGPTYESRFKDIQIVLTELESMNRADPEFRGRLDVKRVGVCGWSTGGVCAAQFCLQDARVQVGVLLDPGLISYVPSLLSRGIAKPFLVITGELPDGKQLFDIATGPAYWLNIMGASHLHMGNVEVTRQGGAKNRRLAQVLQAYTLSMFDRYLRGEDNRLLDGASPLFPEVQRILKKP
jgi:hypothetical protein